MPLPVLTGQKVVLRSPRRSDAESIQRFANDRLVARYLPRLPHPYTMADARRWVEYCYRESRLDRSYNFAIIESGVDEVVGMIGLRNINRADRNAELGYWVARPLWGQGLASEAIRLMLAYAFKHLRLHRVYAVVVDVNTASWKVLRSNGFQREAVMREASLISRKWHDVFSFGILSRDFDGRHRRR